jgi:hypothetical protein
MFQFYTITKNKDMKKSNLIGAFAGFYFGAVLTALTEVGLSDLRWYIIVLPTILLFQWKENVSKNED